ncbi:HAD-superfamily hydrolase, subfamily IA, variant 3 [Russula earlei]|uniref:HAD-superfamily hydrolase, subfamily IA, variant 3 n=1 Tax=Russula earlei TaxID=71964 RepID=A0ACC0TSV5_9AGAM|nr:HAD-superfamily hydrolase, subfamily IA, variant 3 [Russula earlei]
MNLDTVIFDMDGLLIDSEPLWQEAADEVFKLYGVNLTHEQYITTTGLRTKEFVHWWFTHFQLGEEELVRAEKKIIQVVIDKIQRKGAVMPGVQYILDFFEKKKFKIGIASSSPQQLIDVVIGMLGIQPYLKATASAEFLSYGKPHPQVYLNCAELLQSHPTQCICFEDSFNGMIAAKAARMKCVIVPHHSQQKDERWGAADLKLTSLQNFAIF